MFFLTVFTAVNEMPTFSLCLTVFLVFQLGSLETFSYIQDQIILSFLKESGCFMIELA